MLELHRILGDVRNRSAWDDTFIDALSELTETFTFGGVFAHIMTFNAHRRLVSAIPWSMRKLWPLGTGR